MTISTRQKEILNWINSDIYSDDFTLSTASADASFRSYYRLEYNKLSTIVMDAPPEYENIISFIHVSQLLEQTGIHVPTILAQNIKGGFLQLEDLGTTDYLSALNSNSAPELYADALQALCSIQASRVDELPFYDQELLNIEMDLFKDWFLKQHLNLALNKIHEESIEQVKTNLIKSAIDQLSVFVHRDFHSRNLMVTEDNNPGVIDFQDAVVGPITYDLVSLLKDCYIKWTNEEINSWVDYYRSIQPLVKAIPRDQFIKWFDLMGVQRHLKAIGIFARLNHRDNKPGYLKDIPRTLSYITDVAPKYKETEPLMTLIDDLNIVNRITS